MCVAFAFFFLFTEGKKCMRMYLRPNINIDCLEEVLIELID